MDGMVETAATPVPVAGTRIAGADDGDCEDTDMDMPGDNDDFSAPQGESALASPANARALSALDWAALIAIVAGGLNCGLIAAVDLDVFATILPSAIAIRAVYGLIGLAALRCVVLLFRLGDGAD